MLEAVALGTAVLVFLIAGVAGMGELVVTATPEVKVPDADGAGSWEILASFSFLSDGFFLNKRLSRSRKRSFRLAIWAIVV